MANLKFTKDHEWIKIDGDTGTVGISDYAQDSLGDVVFVELPEKGAEFEKGDEVAVVESVKAASEVYAPLSGRITEANSALEDDPSLVNSAPTGDGWFFKIKLKEPSEAEDLMDEADYKKYVESIS